MALKKSIVLKIYLRFSTFYDCLWKQNPCNSKERFLIRWGESFFLSSATAEWSSPAKNPENEWEEGHQLDSALHSCLDPMGIEFVHFSCEHSREKQQPLWGEHRGSLGPSLLQNSSQEPALNSVTVSAAHGQESNRTSWLDLEWSCVEEMRCEVSLGTFISFRHLQTIKGRILKIGKISLHLI